MAMIWFLLFVISLNHAYSQQKVFSDGEELRYVVSYGFISLGEVDMKMTKSVKEGSAMVYSAKCTMKSYEGVPLVKLNSVFESDMVYEGNELYSRWFKATEHKEDAIVVTEYRFHYDSQYVYVKKENNGKVEIDRKITFNKNVKFQDGLSLFYAARLSSFSSENFLVPVFMNEAETSVNYFFSSKPEEIAVSISNHDLKAIRCNGTANFTGIFGLTGEFAGWFSDDDARVPLKSQLNVMIGNITLELDSFKRSGWKLN